MGFFTFENFASRATDATRRDKAWDRAGKLRLVMRNRTILVAVLISPYLSQKVVGLGMRVSAGSTLCVNFNHLIGRMHAETLMRPRARPDRQGL